MSGDLTVFGQLARDLRMTANMRIIDQSEALKMAPHTISEFESGSKIPDIDYIKSFSNWLSLDILKQSTLIKAARGSRNVIDLDVERKRLRKDTQKLFRRVHQMTPVEIRSMRIKPKEIDYEQ